MTQAIVMRNRFRLAVERLLPWYDTEAEARRAERTEQIRQRSIAARIAAERLTCAQVQNVRDAYAAYADAISRKRP